MKKPLTVASFEIIPGTDIDEIRAAHPDWTEDRCRTEQSRVAAEAFAQAMNTRKKQ